MNLPPPVQSLANNDYDTMYDYIVALINSKITYDFTPEVNNRQNILADKELLQIIQAQDKTFYNIITDYINQGHKLPLWILIRLQKTYYTRTTSQFVQKLLAHLANYEYQPGVGYTSTTTLENDLRGIYDGLLRQVHFRDWESKRLLTAGSQLNEQHLYYRRQLREWAKIIREEYLNIRKYRDRTPPPLRVDVSDWTNLQDMGTKLLQFLQTSHHYYG